MSKKNLIVLLVIILAVAAAVALAFIVPAIVKNASHGNIDPTAEPSATDGSNATPEPSRAEEYASRFGYFSAITVTVGDDPKTTANITWQSLDQNVTGYVKYYEKSLGAASAVKAEVSAFNEDISVPVTGQFDFKAPQLEEVKGIIHRCYLTGLKPGTEYVFVAGYENGPESNEQSFKTAADSDSFSFVLVADTQGFTKRNFDVWETLAKKAAEQCPEFDFLIHMGDTVEEGKNHYQWQLYFNAAEKLVSGRQVIDVAGNRDKKHTLLRYTNGAADNRTALVSGYYSFDWGNVHFSILNTGDGEKDLPKSQLKWLESDLVAAEGKTKIILMHKAPYSNANHYNDSEIVAMRAQILPIADQYGVKMVISGHDHFYFRSKPVDGEGNVASCETGNISFSGNNVEMLRSAGTVYFVNGSAGVKQHDNKIDTSASINAAKATLLSGPSFSYISVDSEKIVVLTYVYQNYALSLVDAFGIYLN